MFVFIQLTQANGTNEPIWVNPSLFASIRLTHVNKANPAVTTLFSSSDENEPVKVKEDPETINNLIRQAINS